MTPSPITAATWLEAWESGGGLSPSLRALELLRVACPDAPRAQLAGLPIGHRDALLLDLRAALFGPEVACVVVCPACAERLELELDVAGLRAAPAGAWVDGAAGQRTLELGAYVVRFRLPTGGDLAALDPRAPADEARVALLRACVLEARRHDAPLSVEALPEDVIARVTEAMASADPQAGATLAVRCPACAHAWDADFDIAAFLWRELDAWARRLVRDVHTLARAYGWTEAEVLALGPARRQAYLELAS